MFKPTIQRIFATALQLLNRRHALAIFAGIYATLLATLYGFVAIREATWWQVLWIPQRPYRRPDPQRQIRAVRGQRSTTGNC